MMNKIFLALMASLAFVFTLYTSNAYAGDELAAVNAEVDKRAEQIDKSYGVLLSTQERNDLKIAIVVRKVAANDEGISTVELAARAKKALVTYEITDPMDQRKLLIEMEAQTQAQKGTGSSGNEPDYP